MMDENISQLPKLETRISVDIHVSSHVLFLDTKNRKLVLIETR